MVVLSGALGNKFRTVGGVTLSRTSETFPLPAFDKVAAVALRFGVVIAEVRAVGGHLCIDLRCRVIGHQGIEMEVSTWAWVA